MPSEKMANERFVSPAQAGVHMLHEREKLTILILTSSPRALLDFFPPGELA